MTNALALNGIGYNPMNTMYDSVFSDGLTNDSVLGMNPLYGGMYNPMLGGYGMTNPIYGGMMPSLGNGLLPTDYRKIANMSPEERARYMAEFEEKQYEYAEQRRERMEDREYERSLRRVHRQNTIQAPERAAKSIALKLNQVISMNRKDEVLACFNELKQQLSETPQCKKLEKGPNGKMVTVPLDDKELSAYAREYYTQVTGKDLVEQIKTDLSGSFSHGFVSGLTFGLFGDKNDADTLSEQILGCKRDGANAAARSTGRTLGGAATGAVIGTCICPGVGTLIGAGAGAVVGFISSWF